jgi:hypothetical protein
MLFSNVIYFKIRLTVFRFGYTSDYLFYERTKPMKKLFKIMAVFVLSIAFLFSGIDCKKKDEAVKQEGAVKEEKAAAEQSLPEPGKIAFQKDLIAYGSIQGLDVLLKTVGELVSKFDPGMGASVPMLITQGLQGEVFGTKDLTWMDTSKQFKVCVLNPKAYKDANVLIVPLKDRKLLESSLPENRAKGAEGNELQYSVGMNTYYANFLKDFLVITKDPKTFSAVKGFIEGDFASYQAKGLFDFQISIKSLREIFSEELKTAVSQMAQMPQAQAPLPLPGMGDMLKQETDMLMKILDQSEIAQIEGILDGGNVKIAAKLKVQEKRALDRLIASFSGAKLDLLDLAPANNWLILAGKLDPSLFVNWNKMGMDFLAGILSFTPEEKTKVESLNNQLISLETGDFMFAMYSDGTFPLAASSATGVKDGAKVKTLVSEYYSLLFQKFMNFVKTQAKGSLPPTLDTTSLKGLITSAKPFFDQTGISINLSEEKYQDTTIDILNVAVDYNKIPVKDDPDIQKAKAVVGDKASFTLAFAKDFIIFTFGPNAASEVKRLIDRKTTGEGEKARKAASIVQNPGLIGTVSIPKVLNAFAGLDPDIKMLADKIASAPADFLTFSLGGYGHTVDMNLVVPVDQLSRLAAGQK